MTEHCTSGKFCKNCFYRRSGSDYNWDSWRCSHPNLNLSYCNPVTGDPARKIELCIHVRRDPDLCNINGDWFRSRESVPFSKVATAATLKKITLDDL